MTRSTLFLFLLAALSCSRTEDKQRPGNEAPEGRKPASDVVAASSRPMVDAAAENPLGAKQAQDVVQSQARTDASSVDVVPDAGTATRAGDDKNTKKAVDEPILPPDEPTRKEYIDGKWVYYNFTEAWGLPVGLSPVPENTKVIRDHYDLVVENKKVKSLTKYTSLGKTIWSREYRYRPEDKTGIEGYIETSEQGKVLSVVKFNHSSDTVRVITPGGTSSGRQCYELKRTLDPWGRVLREACFDRGGRPSYDVNGVAVRACELDSKGLVQAESYLSTEGKPSTDNHLVHRVEYERGPDGDPTKISFFGIDKKPILHGFYHAGSMVFDYSHKGLLLSEKYFDEHDVPTLANGGFHGVMYEYDSRGLLVKKTFLGLDGKPKAPDKALAAIIDMSYDDRGRLVKITYSDADNRPTFRAKGIHAERIDYPSEKEEWHTCFGADLVLRQCENGAKLTKVEYGADGMILSISYWSDKDKPGRRGHIFQTHKIVYERNEQGAIIAERWFNTNQKPDSVLGTAAGRLIRYNQFGEVDEETFVNSDGKPADTRWGYATLRRQHDSRGRVVSICLFKADGQPAPSSRSGLPSQGFHCMVWGYGEKALPEALVFKGVDGAEQVVPVADTKLSSAAWRLSWDDGGRLLSMATADSAAGGTPSLVDCTEQQCPDMTPAVWVINP